MLIVLNFRHCFHVTVVENCSH